VQAALSDPGVKEKILKMGVEGIVTLLDLPVLIYGRKPSK
jgi:hypothetical protein